MKNLETLIFLINCINPQECKDMIVDSYNVNGKDNLIVMEQKTEQVEEEDESLRFINILN